MRPRDGTPNGREADNYKQKYLLLSAQHVREIERLERELSTARSQGVLLGLQEAVGLVSGLWQAHDRVSDAFRVIMQRIGSIEVEQSAKNSSAPQDSTEVPQLSAGVLAAADDHNSPSGATEAAGQIRPSREEAVAELGTGKPADPVISEQDSAPAATVAVPTQMQEQIADPARECLKCDQGQPVQLESASQEITEEEIEDWRKKIQAKIFYDFPDDERQRKNLHQSFCALCDLALLGKRSRDAVLEEIAGLTKLRPGVGWCITDQEIRALKDKP